MVREYDGSLVGLRSLLEELFAKPIKPTALCVALVSRMVFTQSWLLSIGYRIPTEVHDEQQGNDSTLEGCWMGVESDEGESASIHAPGTAGGRHRGASKKRPAEGDGASYLEIGRH